MGNFNNKFVSYKMIETPAFLKDKLELNNNNSEYEINIDDFVLVPQSEFFSQEIESPEIKSEILIKPLQSKKTIESNYNNKKEVKPKSKIEYKGLTKFEKAFELALKIDPSIQLYKPFLLKTAELESKFDSNILNEAGALRYGYFLMGPNEIKTTTGLTVDLFRNDPVLLILGAVNLYKYNLKILKSIGAYDLCKQQGYSNDAIVAGAWVGGAGNVKKFIQGKGDASDSHYYNNSNKGTSVGKRMKIFNNV